ncbi:uncharacterized protein T551_01927 [Pneumocystis jirovecii RU7]|uniref:Uncharacterized protein n=1 Tax=Pneumocystis jirovecii (strain RU7) TaxID=1408657 RepID=A0A0W4ZNP1_PNEJ7|nr:uncharacterized protein T551_01927 [Pneumocystis jirovecii RU7]KTW29983.1 hypothetical protein T551_01927 [Pneumocystis jirovecii RU7]
METIFSCLMARIHFFIISNKSHSMNFLSSINNSWKSLVNIVNIEYIDKIYNNIFRINLNWKSELFIYDLRI